MHITNLVELLCRLFQYIIFKPMVVALPLTFSRSLAFEMFKLCSFLLFLMDIKIYCFKNINCSLLANECIDAVMNAGRVGIICKIDMEKAYDHINRAYMDWVLQRMGFGTKWINWIRICVSSPSFSILVNGFPKGFFKANRGLRLRDLLSPYLFIMAAELLGRMVLRAESVGLSKGLFPFGGGTTIPFIQFADDFVLVEG